MVVAALLSKYLQHESREGRLLLIEVRDVAIFVSALVQK